ncbi:MAG: septal ring lytic transglycosylase RlpA family protein [Gammaproteobacteria bacterium]|nr:septal ring lytic transglycosylase RlpA family protein [Gammaproteobacteria bacterium]NVK88543.1 septal ring lytic transglycosylase RlpA family protein [Gammaproteobacteria bacterium]
MKLLRVLSQSLITIAALLWLSGCSWFEVQDSGPTKPVDVSQVPDAVPKVEPLSRYGNPAFYEHEGIRYTILSSASGYKERGVASWYGTKFHGERTSSGEPYDMYTMTAAHKTLPLPTYARVTNLANGRQVVVKINDRGPFKEGRIIDLSYAAAVKLGFHHLGTTQVEVETIVLEGSHEISGPSSVPADKQTYVQVGAFSDREKAQTLVAAIAQQVPWEVSLSSVRVNRKLLHRVRIGPISSLDEANRLVETLTIPALGTPRVIFE